MKRCPFGVGISNHRGRMQYSESVDLRPNQRDDIQEEVNPNEEAWRDADAFQLCTPDGTGFGIFRNPIKEWPKASSAYLIETGHEEED